MERKYNMIYGKNTSSLYISYMAYSWEQFKPRDVKKTLECVCDPPCQLPSPFRHGLLAQSCPGTSCKDRTFDLIGGKPWSHWSHDADLISATSLLFLLSLLLLGKDSIMLTICCQKLFFCSRAGLFAPRQLRRGPPEASDTASRGCWERWQTWVLFRPLGCFDQQQPLPLPPAVEHAGPQEKVPWALSSMEAWLSSCGWYTTLGKCAVSSHAMSC